MNATKKRKKMTLIDWLMLVVVVVIACVVIALSFDNTAKLATSIGAPPLFTAALVEAGFACLLFIRSRQRALSRNVPLFLHAGYFTSFAFVTGVNIYGLAQVNAVIGSIVGLAISGAMWLMETVLVWLWVDADKPYVQSIRGQMRATKQDIKAEQARQRIAWMKYEAAKPDLKLIEDARKAEQRRQETVEGGLPEFFRTQAVELPTVAREKNKVVPMNPIGFQVGDKVGETLVHQGKQDIDHGEKYIQQAIDAAQEMITQGQVAGKDFGRNTLAKMAGVTPHYAKLALQRIKEDMANGQD